MHMCLVALESINQELAVARKSKLVLMNTSLVFFLVFIFLVFFFFFLHLRVVFAPVKSFLGMKSLAVGFEVMIALVVVVVCISLLGK